MNKLAQTLKNIAIVVISFIIISYIWQCVNTDEIVTTTPKGSKEMPLINVN